MAFGEPSDTAKHFFWELLTGKLQFGREWWLWADFVENSHAEKPTFNTDTDYDLVAETDKAIYFPSTR